MRGLAAAIALAALLPAAQAQETMRDRIKARIEQRRAERGQDAPLQQGAGFPGA